MCSPMYNLRAINETIRYIIKKHRFTFHKLVNFGKVNQIYLFVVSAIKIVRSLHKLSDLCILNAKETVVNF